CCCRRRVARRVVSCAAIRGLPLASSSVAPRLTTACVHACLPIASRSGTLPRGAPGGPTGRRRRVCRAVGRDLLRADRLRGTRGAGGLTGTRRSRCSRRRWRRRQGGLRPRRDLETQLFGILPRVELDAVRGDKRDLHAVDLVTLTHDPCLAVADLLEEGDVALAGHRGSHELELAANDLTRPVLGSEDR